MEATIAELIEWQERCRDLQAANGYLLEEAERLRGLLKRARASVDLLLEENTRLEAKASDLSATVDRLRLFIAQGAEL